jgi:GDPmannose 4,6-dehydratase
MKKALICGVGGQDGSYLARLLLEREYEVVGTSRDVMAASFANLKRLGIRERVKTESMAITDFRSVLQTITRHRPDEIYNLAGQSSVSLSFDQPVETMDSISGGTLNLLEAIRFAGHPIRFYNAGSCECFGDTGDRAANEQTPFRPRSPYAVAKASAHWLTSNYREAYDLFACTGVLFNHESPLRQERFVTQKVVRAAARIARGSTERLRLGNANIQRDWGWAPDYVEAIWRMLQMPKPDDYVIATGNTYSLEHFVREVFRYFSLEWEEHVEIDSTLFRPADIHVSKADPAKARTSLGWRHKLELDQVIARMCQAAYSNEKASNDDADNPAGKPFSLN